jgi:flagellar biogenesis protein FliO
MAAPAPTAPAGSEEPAPNARDESAVVEPSQAETSLWWRIVGPAAVLGLLGAAAFALTRRRRTRAAPLELVGTLSLGPRRQLVVARFGDDELLLGSSEAGLQLLVRRTPARTSAAHGTDDVWLTSLASDRDEQLAQPPEPLPPEDPAYAAAVEVAPHGAAFEAVLDDSIEDQSLRQKLAAGLRGRRS